MAWRGLGSACYNHGWTARWLLCLLLYNLQIDYQGNVTLLTQSMYMSKCKVLDESSKDYIAFIFQRVKSLRHICLCTSVNCVVQSLVQCRMSLAAHFSRSMWPTTRLTHKDASSPLPLGLMQFLGWVESGWENLRKSFVELFFLHQINLTIGNQVDKEEMRNGYSPSGDFQ